MAETSELDPLDVAAASELGLLDVADSSGHRWLDAADFFELGLLAVVGIAVDRSVAALVEHPFVRYFDLAVPDLARFFAVPAENVEPALRHFVAALAGLVVLAVARCAAAFAVALAGHAVPVVAPVVQRFVAAFVAAIAGHAELVAAPAVALAEPAAPALGRRVAGLVVLLVELAVVAPVAELALDYHADRPTWVGQRHCSSANTGLRWRPSFSTDIPSSSSSTNL